MLSGPGHERPLRGHVRFAAAQRLLIQRGGAQVPVNVAGANDAQGLQPMRPLNLYGHLCSTPGRASRRPQNGRLIAAAVFLSEERADRTRILLNQ